jgi:UDP-GlcNAc:undecaprenyl-phosphate GlcNAc-1-phosphate transferase
MIPYTSFFLSVFIILILRFVFRKLNWLDKPERFGHQRKPVPYGMGIVFFFVFLILSLSFLQPSAKLILLLLSSGVLCVVSFLDDRLGLPAWFRLLVQIICAATVVLAGVGVPAISNPFGNPIVLDSIKWNLDLVFSVLRIEPIADLVAIFWIVFVVNAMNWLDGAPGIVSGISTISCAVIYLLASMAGIHVIDQTDLLTMVLIVGASSFAFLLFDFPKPKILMGDSGAMFLGFMISVMAMYSGGKMATAVIVLAFPILDAIWTITRRILTCQSPFRGDFQHFHHELMKAGLSEREVNVFYYIVSLGFGAFTLYLQSFGKLLAIIILFVLMLSIRLFLAKTTARSSH